MSRPMAKLSRGLGTGLWIAARQVTLQNGLAADGAFDLKPR